MIEKKEPLPINYYTIFEALENILPDHCMIVLKAIKKIVLITNEMPGFMTLGITKDGRLLIYEKFWNQYVTSQDALQTLLYHELLHFIAGDVYTIKPNPDNDPDIELHNIADNIAMDSRINAFINKTREDIDSTLFLKEFYDDKRCEEEPLHKLLRPESIFSKQEANLSEEYNKFYESNDLSSHHLLSELVYEELKKRKGNGKNKDKKIIIKLLGAHGSSGEGELSKEDLEGAEVIEIDMRDVDEAKRKKLQEAQKNSDKNRGQEKLQELEEQKDPTSSEAIKEAIIDHLAGGGTAPGKGSQLVTQLLDQCLGLTEKFDLNKFKKMAFDNIFHNVRTQARLKVDRYTTAPYIPKRISTVDSILLAAKVPVLLYKHNKFAYKIDKNLLPIYLDVSGSTFPYLAEIVKLIANVSDQLDYVWGFSTKIVKHSTQQLSDGKIDTTGGTDFTCVIDHAVENKFKHIVVITDGEGYAQKYDNARVPSIDSVVTILFGSAWKENYFTRLYENTHMIDEVKI